MFSRIYQASEKHGRGQQQKEREIAIRNYYLPFMAQVKNLPAMQETWVWSLGWEDRLEKEMATHSSTLAWRIPTDRGAWRAMVHRIAKNRTRLSNWMQHSAFPEPPASTPFPSNSPPAFLSTPSGNSRAGGASPPRYTHPPFPLNPCCLPQNGAFGGISATLLTKVKVTTSDLHTQAYATLSDADGVKLLTLLPPGVFITSRASCGHCNGSVTGIDAADISFILPFVFTGA